MKSITIHGMDDELAKLIESRARAENLSINKTIKQMLEEATGIVPRDSGKYRSNFEEFFGLWSESEVEAFLKRTQDLRAVHSGDWQ